MNHPSRATPTPGAAPARRLLYLLLLLATMLPGLRAAPPAGFAVEDVLTGLNQPISLRFLPDGRLLVLLKQGQILITDVAATTPQSQLYLDLASSAHPHGIKFDQERGLLDIAVDPDFPTQPYIYLLYTPNSGPDGQRLRVARFTHVPNSGGLTSRANPGSEVILWQDTDGYDSCCHFGGALDFGPDGKLWFATGDHFQGSYAASVEHAGGGVHRINKDGSIPADNPYADGAGPNVDSLVAIGLRNPFRARWDLASNRFFIAEVGGNTQSIAWEDLHVIDYDPLTGSIVDEDYGTAEDNFQFDGINFGWPTVEGLPPHTDFPGWTIDDVVGEPMFAYRHAGVTAAINGGVVYRGSQFPTEYRGAYFYADSTRDFIRYLRFNSDGSVAPNPNPAPLSNKNPDSISYTFDSAPPGRMVALEAGPDGSLYVVSFTDSGGAYGQTDPSVLGAVRRYVYDGGNSWPVISEFSVTPASGPSPLDVTFQLRASDPESHPMTYVLHFGDGTQSGPIALGANTTTPISHTYASDGPYNARVEVADLTRTTTAELTVSVGTPPTITALTVTNSRPGSTHDWFRYGDTMTFSADAADAEDGSLPAAQFSWSIAFVRPGNIHPTFGPATNTKTINFPIPSQGQGFSQDVYYRCFLTVTDSSGLTTTSHLDIFPETSTISFNTNPTGIVVQVDGNTAAPAPFSMASLVNFDHVVTVPASKCVNGTEYIFSHWSTGDTSPQLTYNVPVEDSSLTAVYTATGPCAGPPEEGLVMHLRSDLGVVRSGSTVTAWEDQSGNNNVLSAVGQPQYVENLLNGRPGIRLDGVDDALSRTGTVALPTGAADRSVFMVARYQGAGTGKGWAGFAYGTAAVNQAFGLALTPTGLLGVQAWGTDFVSNPATNGLGEWLTQGAITSGTTLRQYHGDTLIGTHTHTFATGAGGIRLGEELNGAKNLPMDVAEVLVYNRALNDPERQQVATYLSNQYALGSSGGGAAPLVTILSPANGATYTTAQMPVSFSATATDAEDGDVAASLVWTSSLSGNLGTGPTLSATLAAGTHVITARATDSDAQTGSADLSVIVTTDSTGGTSLPTDGLVVHLESDLNVSLQSGNTVAGWLDQSGLGNDLIAGGNPILVSAATPSGRPAIALDGDGDKLERLHATAPLGGLPTGNADRTVLVAARYHSTTAWAGVSYGKGASNQAFGVVIRHPSGELVLQGWGAANDRITTTLGRGAGWMVTTALLQNGSATLFRDGTALTQWAHTYATTLDRLTLGAEISGLGFVAMDLAAVLIYDRALDATERAAAELYLANKYFQTASGNTAPAVSITAPADGTSVAAGTAVTFTGTATDTEDGDLSADLTWTSSLSGNLGTGASITTSSLASGTHTITAAVTDNGGLTASRTVTLTVGGASTAITPTSVVPLFNGTSLSGLYPWFSTSGFSDPNGIFTVQDGLLRVHGDAWGALTTEARYRDYQMVLEFKWGDKTWGSRAGKARDAGISLHSNGVEGGWSGLLMPSIHAQIMEGSMGDFILLAGTDASGAPVPMSLSAKTHQVTCTGGNWNCRGGYRWDPAGATITHTQDLRTVHWGDWDPGWLDVAGYRGAVDHESTHGDWNQMVVIAQGSTIQIFLNGVKVNEAFNVTPSEGKIQLEVEWADFFVRRWELRPLGAALPPTIVTNSLTPATAQAAYAADVKATGATTPYSWAIASGSLPAGLTLNSATGRIAGTPTATGTSQFQVRVTAANGTTATQPFSLTVGAASSTVPVTDGLVLHLDAADGVASSGTTVTGWSDRSGRGNHVTPSGNPQLLPTGTPGGRPAVSLDGSGDKLERLHASAPLSGLPTANANRSIFLVAAYHGSGAWGGVSYGTAATNQTFGLIVKHPSGELVLQGYGGSRDLVSTASGIGAGWLVQSGVLNNGTATLFKNGAQVAQRTNTYGTTLTKLVIGQEIGGLGYVTMDVAAVLIYDRALSATERASVESYLQQRYLTGGTANQPPAVTISAPADGSTFAEGASITFTGTASDPEQGSLTSSLAWSSNASGSLGTGGSLTTTSLAPGTHTITAAVTDAGGLTTSATVTLTVSATSTNTAPTISSIADQTVTAGTSTSALPFTIGDAQTAAGSLTVTRTTSNATLVPLANIVLGGTGASRTVTVTPASGQTGTATVTLTVSDGSLTASSSFTVTVTASSTATDLWMGLPFEETSGTQAIDVSGHGHHGTLTSGVTRVAGGRYGRAVDIRNSGGRVNLGKLDIPGSALTLAAWIRPDTFGSGNEGRIISKASGTAAHSHFWMLSSVDSSGIKPRFRLRTSSGGTTTLVGTTPLSTGVWTHVAATYDGGSMKLYVNGVLAGSTAKTGTILQNTSVSAAIGDQPQGGKRFDGLIDDVRIYTRAFTQAEIQTLMNQGL